MPDSPRQRLDQWLWHARFFRSRTLASALCRAARVRVNGRIIARASATVSPGQVLTFPQGDIIRVVKVTGLATRRGPAVEAKALYEDLTPAQKRLKSNFNPRPGLRSKGAGRPTKRDRRRTDALKKSL